jgi:hypothetical protein
MDNQNRKISFKLDELMENSQPHPQNTKPTTIIPSQQSSQGNRILQLKQDIKDPTKNDLSYSQREK